MIGFKARALVWVTFFASVLVPAGCLPTPLGIKAISVPLALAFLYAVGTAGKYLKWYGGMRSPRDKVKRLVREGPYSCMRHPMHFSQALFMIFLGLSLSWCSFIVSLIIALLIIIMAIKLDEKEATEMFGKEYLDYSSKVPPVSLKPSCLLKLFLRKRVRSSSEPSP